MKVSFIQPPSDLVSNDRLEPPLGLMYLASYLKELGHESEILDFSGGHHPKITESDIYGFSTFTPSYSWCLRKQKEIREQYPHAVMIAGSCHVSALPDTCSNDWDHIIIGEGELGIKSFLAGDSRRIIREQVIEELDQLPFPDYSDIEMDSYDRRVGEFHVLSVLTSRGCPFDCAFCNSNIWKRKKVRFRSAENIAKEIEYLIGTFYSRHFRFVDDLFCISERRIEELEKVLSPLEIQYRCNGRVNRFTEKMADLLVKSGCIQIAFGVESGSDEILRRMEKGQTTEQIRRAIRIAKDVGIIVRAYVIVGFPGEDWDTLEETIELMLSTRPDEIIVFAPVPFPGSSIFRYPENFGISEIETDFDKYSQISKNHETHYLLSHATANRKEIAEMRAYALERLSRIAWVEGVSEDINIAEAIA